MISFDIIWKLPSFIKWFTRTTGVLSSKMDAHGQVPILSIKKGADNAPLKDTSLVLNYSVFEF